MFKLYLLKEYQRLKDEENDRLKLEWDSSFVYFTAVFRPFFHCVKTKLLLNDNPHRKDKMTKLPLNTMDHGKYEDTLFTPDTDNTVIEYGVV